MNDQTQDLSSPFLQRAKTVTRQNDTAEMETWMRSFTDQEPTAGSTRVETYSPPSPVQGTPLAAPPSTLRPPVDTYKPSPTQPDAIGRPTNTGSGGFFRNIAEIPGAIAAGIDSAVHNALAFANPLTDWLNQNVADLSYSRTAPQTPTGQVTKSISEFLTGFIPAMKGLKALGMTGRIATPAAAGAIADFATKDGHEARLSNLWQEAGLPRNILTDALAADPSDHELVGRAKAAVEGLGVGVAADGIIHAIKFLRSARGVTGARQTESEYLIQKYGELTEADMAKVLGDPSKPTVISTVARPGPAAQRIGDALEDVTSRIEPSAMVRKIPRVRGAARGATPDTVVITKDGEQVHVAKDQESAIAWLADQTGVAKENLAKGHVDDEGTEWAFKAAPGAPARPTIGNDDFEVYINFGRMDTPDQVKFAIGKLAEANKPAIDEARRGVQTQEMTQQLADDLGMTVTELLSRRKGQAFNAEESLAARQLWIASGESLVEAAKKASAVDASPLDQFAFRKAMAVHSAIQNEVLGARAEAARALAQWNIPAKGSGVENARAIEQIMSAMGGPEHARDMARRIAILAQSGATSADIGRFAQRGYASATADAVKEIFINGLLSSPKTHVVNVFSNSLVAMQQIYERAAAAGISSITGGGGVEMAESFAMTYGLTSGIRDAFRAAAVALRTGDTGGALGKVDIPFPKALSAEAFRISRETGLGRAIDFIGTGFNVPSRLLGAEDEFFKSIGYRMEVHAQAARQAFGAEGLSGNEALRRMTDLINNPPDHIRINAADAALYNTFTNETGKFGQAVMRLRDIDTPLNPLTFILPFVRTPVNIARYAFERTPFAPLVGQWRADIAAGGARSDLALARMSTGTAIMTWAMDAAFSGQISGAGPGDGDGALKEAMLRQGWQPNSIRIGDRWYSYNRSDPFGMTVGFAASIAEAVQKGEIDEEDVDEWYEVVGMSIASVSQVVINKTYLEGLANIVEVASQPKRYTQSYVNNLIASFVPFTAGLAAVEGLVDPTSREAQSPAEAIQARIAGLSANLPARMDLWGRPITNMSGLGSFYDFTSPVASKPQTPNPIDKEILTLGQGPSRVTKRTSFMGVEVNFKQHPKVYEEYVRLAGNGAKHPAWNMGAMDYLNEVVSGAHPMSAVYKIMSPESKRAFIISTVSDYRKIAQQQIMSDPRFADFAANVNRLKAIHQNNRLPVMENPQ
jgi:hypothetical protein